MCSQLEQADTTLLNSAPIPPSEVQDCPLRAKSKKHMCKSLATQKKYSPFTWSFQKNSYQGVFLSFLPI